MTTTPSPSLSCAVTVVTAASWPLRTKMKTFVLPQAELQNEQSEVRRRQIQKGPKFSIEWWDTFVCTACMSVDSSVSVPEKIKLFKCLDRHRTLQLQLHQLHELQSRTVYMNRLDRKKFRQKYIFHFVNSPKKAIKLLTLSSTSPGPENLSSWVESSTLWTSLTCFLRFFLFFHLKTRPQNSHETSCFFSCLWR